MDSVTINVRIDAQDKKKFEQFCEDVGINISTAINMFVKTVNREQRLPFEVRSLSYDDYVVEKLKAAEEEMKYSSKRYSKEEVIESIKNMLED